MRARHNGFAPQPSQYDCCIETSFPERCSTNDPVHFSSMNRFPTTIPGLDEILHGGLFEGGVYILEGPPGVGKTTLANQIAYSHALKGQKTLYVTMLSESHARMVQHMDGQAFFHKSAVNSLVLYISGYRELETEGLKAVIGLLRGELARSGASLLVVDGLVVSAPDIDEGVRQFVHELQSLVIAMSCTCLLLTSGRGNALSAEQTMVDGIFTFEDHLFRGKAERRFQVRKFRGSEVVRGQHSFCITSDGLRFFPRLESLPLRPKEAAPACRVKLGTRAVDDALNYDGVGSGTMSLAVGESGTGKTLLALAFAAQASVEQPGLLLLGSPETPFDACALAEGFGIPLKQAMASGALHVQSIGQTDESLDEMGHKILRLVHERKAARVALDGLAALADTSAFPERGHRFLGRLLHELRRAHATSLFTLDPAELSLAGGTPLAPGVSALFDNLLTLTGGRERQLTVAKMRGAPTATTSVALVGSA
ncbi:RAD55 family ATPase [Roseateles sp. DC23W]|uniref:RAD55 family ATPase n=1 Tax=Pelomonas dachongensis TaxID=3299029 RepID=A0ABW7EMK8_9BURK